MTILKHEIKNQLEAWLLGIYSEIEFWNNYIGLKGGKYKEKWEITTDKNRRFVLEDEIPDDIIGKEFDFIDVGSGPFSRCGFATKKVSLNHIAVDPLADAYKALKKSAGLETGINLRTGFVELLDRTFEKNSFDLVHMSNSLDHSFDPILGIYQLINICKVGGKILLRHKENEAVNGQYGGLHQWNLSVDIEKNKFIIWRNDEFYCVNDLFDEYVEIRCSKDPLESIFNRVEMRKKKDILVPQSDIYDTMLTHIYSFMIKTIMNDVLIGKNSPKAIFIEEMTKKIRSLSEKEIENYFFEKGWKKIVIYGLGIVGEELLNRISETSIKVDSIIDQRECKWREINTIALEKYIFDEKVDLFIITTFSGTEMIRKNIEILGVDCKKIRTISEMFD